MELVWPSQPVSDRGGRADAREQGGDVKTKKRGRKYVVKPGLGQKVSCQGRSPTTTHKISATTDRTKGGNEIHLWGRTQNSHVDEQKGERTVKKERAELWGGGTRHKGRTLGCEIKASKGET